MATILAGLKILDLTEGMAGSIATMLLADNGAEVTKVERPGGDPYRTEAAWVMWNRGKKSVVLDLKTPAGVLAVRKLAQQADILIENFKPGTADSLGVGFAALSALNPRLIYGSMTAIGSKGKHRHFKPYNSIVEAKAGGLLARGKSGVAPVYRVRPRGDIGSAFTMVQGIAGALRVRDMSGRGQRLESTVFAGVVFTDSGGAVARQEELGIMSKPARSGSPRSATINLRYINVRTKDGQWVQMANMTDRLFANLVKASGMEARKVTTREDVLEYRKIIYKTMQEKTLDEWMAIFKKGDVAGDCYLTTQQAMDSDYVAAINGTVEIDDPNVGKTRQIGALVEFSKTPSQIGKPSARLGEHTDAVLKALPGGAPKAVAAPAAKPLPEHPLAGMLLLDFSTFNASPQGASLIADLGARVIKVESPTSEDAPGGVIGKGRTFQGKESICVDLKTAEGREIMDRLLAKADGLLHNMRGDTPSKLGLDYESVKKLNPNIVYAYAASYGSRGPGAGRAAFHPIAGCLSGGPLWQLGQGNNPPPADVAMSLEEIEKWSEILMAGNESLPDQNSALGVGTGLALALYHKAHTGEGQYVETRMLMTNLYLCSDDFIRYAGKPERLQPDSKLRGLHALHRLYETKEGWLFLDCPLQEEWEALCDAIGRKDLLTDPRFATREARIRNDEWLLAVLWPVLRTRTADDWEAYLDKYDVAAARADAQRYEDFLLLDAGVRDAGLVVDVEHATTGMMMRVSPAIEFSLTPSRAGAPHVFGEDTPAVLAQLGYSQKAIEEFRKKDIVRWSQAPALGEAVTAG